MVILDWVRRLFKTIWPRNRWGNELFLDEKWFRFELARERMRVDRNASPLAVLTIDLPAGRSTARDFDFLSRVLMRRLRVTDTVGFLSEMQVGVLLPDTTKSGAWKLATDICSVYPIGHDRPDCDVHVYPEDSTHRREGTNQSEEGAVKPQIASSIESLFANPTPKWKRAIDVIGACSAIVLSAPLIFAAAIAIKLTSRGPVFYSQEREGLGGRRFQIYKLRTMQLGAEEQQSQLRLFSEQDGPAFKMRDDPRTTRVGRLLRMTSLDELPQLWNVLRGEMSLVGPRPLPVDESLQCTSWQRRRLSVLPGMTCIWQVRGRNTVTFDRWMRMDLEYVRCRSLACDLQLLVTTGPSIVFSRGPR